MKPLLTLLITLFILLYSCSNSPMEPELTHLDLLTSGLWLYEETQSEPLLLYYLFNADNTGNMTRILTDDYGEFTNKTSHEISWVLAFPTLTINNLVLTITKLDSKVLVLNGYTFNKVDTLN